MARSKWLTGISVFALGAGLVAAQQQQATTRPAQQSRPRQARGLVQPWNHIKDLNEDAKTKISEIHRKAVEERAAITARERQNIMALLSDDQKKQVNDFEIQRARTRNNPATRPAGR